MSPGAQCASSTRPEPAARNTPSRGWTWKRANTAPTVYGARSTTVRPSRRTVIAFDNDASGAPTSVTAATTATNNTRPNRANTQGVTTPANRPQFPSLTGPVVGLSHALVLSRPDGQIGQRPSRPERGGSSGASPVTPVSPNEAVPRASSTRSVRR